MLAGEAWRLSPSVSVRPEPFGALVYDFSTRRLSFLKTLLLLDVVRRLDGASDVDEALRSAGVGDGERAGYLRALDGLAASGVLIRSTP
ncbi:mycofactocin biosynthesis chaperone MftB [Nocardioides currus]|uniref:Mycofactocin biosynthesis chaperone MftB n=1 Tax=Nocardioides currus TaxID=2133958 RepID=A0A2R7YZ31_9ACTN|nr:mycofactocin biosynthesis chaperone MftB [Nocardioides currus]PUA81625.1 mycofactocin biosynthesis chaperone MftB [Nocardioides currus]